MRHEMHPCGFKAIYAMLDLLFQDVHLSVAADGTPFLDNHTFVRLTYPLLVKLCVVVHRIFELVLDYNIHTAVQW